MIFLTLEPSSNSNSDKNNFYIARRNSTAVKRYALYDVPFDRSMYRPNHGVPYFWVGLGSVAKKYVWEGKSYKMLGLDGLKKAEKVAIAPTADVYR